ncbi:MAG: hypothetical protein U9R17_16450, partial [Thermodesulfobacteriota bacterium]|nr:hypothetical protein [Thermodesulfobacteriota bacterium]
MRLTNKLTLIPILMVLLLPLALAHGEEGKDSGTNIVLTPADQMILDAIDKVNDRIDNLGKNLNNRIDKVNERIDNLWITMLGGFLGVMAFIGAIVFWDRRTYLKLARQEFRNEISDDRKKLNAMLAAMKKLANQFPEVSEV